MSEQLREELTKAQKEMHILGIRLTLAQAWVGFLNKGYEALLYHGVNYRTLKEYNGTELDDAQKLPISKARDKIILWLGRMESAVHAAVRRKNFKVHENDPA
ncbi:hypothetical protein [Brucella intermedia]|uniref:hypothetical protein n=1 Tax=Brucella intermedia TaxID=94625 RepID=UPI00224B36D1|nr:hypothetical protein [Brucella intermedia]